VSAVQAQLRGHGLACLVAIASVGIVIAGGRLFAAPVLNAGFDPKHMPVEAVDYLGQKGISSNLAVPDGWSGYVIYRLYPDIRPSWMTGMTSTAPNT
jgi:hypothetical protein